jgi:acyl-coenzyme A thioesterase PaaI-like protein
MDDNSRNDISRDDTFVPMRSSSAPIPGASIPIHYKWCFGCGVDHPSGLHMQITAGEGLTAQGVFTVTDDHQGAPGLAHGGLLSAAIDEILGSLNWLLGVPAVTGRLECDFRKPVPVGTTLYIHASIEAMHGRKVYTAARAHMNDPDGPIAIEAKALFVQVKLEHFVRNGNQTEVAAAVSDKSSKWSDMADADLSHGSEFEVNP